jgi:ATP-dependent Clp protease ATP-binding subunit ClpA
MYSFERFNEDAKRTLTYAQEEAERSHHSYIGTEHLLLGLLRVEKGTAYRVLSDLGIAIDPVRKVIESVLGRNERTIIQQIIPTSRVKTVIEISFEEARAMAHSEVDTGHMLIGLMIEGEGIAAHVLEDLGATHDLVVAAVQRELGAPATHRPPRRDRPVGPTPSWRIGRPAQVRTPVDDFTRLLNSPPIVKLLKARALDVDALLGQLGKPPAKVVLLRNDLDNAQNALDTTVMAQQFEHAARLRDDVNRLLETLAKAEEEWLDSLP